MGPATNFQNLFLYALCTLIWGSTWFAITWQVDAASPIASVFWRFLIAFLILLPVCFITKKTMKYSRQQHMLFASQGVFMFSVNYMLTYLAETMATSGLVALGFCTLIYYNMIGMRVFFGKPITKNVIWGSVLGGIGMVFLFMNEILHFDPHSKTIWGLLVGVLATFFASMGNMVAQKSFSLKVPVMVTNTYGMLYGFLFTLLVGLVVQTNFAIPLTPRYISALLYLALFGTVIAFGAYLLLAGRIGAEKAAYTSVLNPVIALIISSFFENFKWTPYIAVGVVLCLAGNVFTLYKSAAKKA